MQQPQQPSSPSHDDHDFQPTSSLLSQTPQSKSYLKYITPNFPINNPFINDDHENFPPLSFDDISSQSSPNNSDILDTSTLEHDPNISLNLSIDTLAKIKPVDISNLSDFLKEKELEELFEESQRHVIEEEDANYFKQRKEDLSPQSKKGHGIVLYSSFMEHQDAPLNSSTPTKSPQHQDDEEEQEFSFTSPPQFLSPILGNGELGNRRAEIYYSPNYKITPKAAKGHMDELFLSPIRGTATNTVAPNSPLMTPDSKIFKSISASKIEPQVPTENKRKISVAKKLDFHQQDDFSPVEGTFLPSNLNTSKANFDSNSNNNNQCKNTSHQTSLIYPTSNNASCHQEKLTPKKVVSFQIDSQTQTSPRECDDEPSTPLSSKFTSLLFPLSFNDNNTTNSILTRCCSIGTQTNVDQSTQTSPTNTTTSMKCFDAYSDVVCPNCSNKIPLSDIVEYNMISFTETSPMTTLVSNHHGHNMATNFSRSTPYRTNNVSNNSTTNYTSTPSTRSYHSQQISYNSHYPSSYSRYSFPSTVTSRVYTNYHHETHIFSEYRKPLSPLNYALVKQRYKTQISHFDKYNTNRNSFHLS
ncbi:hypothetical protein C9374_001269 [Naegleria lovaniensis]|uniref:Uncharacterized protein n=1 Tax=Naegleria lovaniensis TaxID=51637 RepID=A0AA88GVI0_NAELO|nr:uncharacterized protein C9374_001269 [Naegleria lovaniensis]KAG2387675.1 hypothetical protein C9374_001269 [Naegleria lovaniensis]